MFIGHKFIGYIGCDATQKQTELTAEMLDSCHLCKLIITNTIERSRVEAALKESEKKFRILFDTAPVLLNSFDEHGRCILWNKECEKLFGWTIEELNSHENPLALRYPDSEMQRKVLAAATSQPEKAFREWHPITKNGEKLITSWSNVRLPSGMIINIGHDITERKRAEEVLQQAKKEAEAASLAKSEFLANMSHEIRTPMNTVIGMSQMLMRTELNDKQKDYVNAVQNSSHLLLGIINDILDFSKIEAGKLELESHNFQTDELLGQMKSLFGMIAGDKHIDLFFHLSPDLPRALVGDSLRLGQVLANLLSNAIKFTDKGRVELSVTRVNTSEKQADCDSPGASDSEPGDSEPSEDVRVRFEVRDTGIGLSKEQADTLFQAFSQADTSTTRKYGGTGLGLVISSRLIERMGGVLEVESVPGKGSAFFFELNFLVGAPTAPAETNAIEIPVLNDYVVLLVEDNRMNQEVVLNMLEDTGVEIVIADNGRVALETLEKRRFDLILMDLQMPVMDGFEAIRRIRKDHAELPIVALSAAAMDADRAKSLEAGADCHLAKPVDCGELYTVLCRYLKSRGKKVQSRTHDSVSASALPESLKGFDLLKGLKCANNKADFYHKMLLRFKELLNGEFSDIMETSDKDNKEDTHRKTHTLKGLAATFGAVHLAEAVATVHQALKDGTEITAEMRQKLRQNMAEVKTGLASLPPVPDASAEAGQEQGAAAVQKILDVLRENKIPDREMLKTAVRYLRETVGGDKPNEFGRLVYNFEYDAAVALLSELSAKTERKLL